MPKPANRLRTSHTRPGSSSTEPCHRLPPQLKRLGPIPQKSQDEAQLGFAEQRVDRAHDHGLAAERDSIANLKRLLAA